MRSALKAIVFDFDGVIANSEPLHFRAFRDVLASANVTLTENDYYTRHLGYSDEGVFERISAEGKLEWTCDRIASLLDEKRRAMEALERDGSVLFPGAADAVRRAADAAPLAIASGAIRQEIVRVLGRENLSRFFPVIVSAEDTPRSKPAPDPYARAVDLLSASIGARIDPRECVAVEDSIWGIESARAAGLRTVAVAHTYDAQRLIESDLTICSISDLDLQALRALVAG
jgi:beta-phosphoglucomutase-like phosphatase (HAD superfamily)